MRFEVTCEVRPEAFSLGLIDTREPILRGMGTELVLVLAAIGVTTDHRKWRIVGIHGDGKIVATLSRRISSAQRQSCAVAVAIVRDC